MQARTLSRATLFAALTLAFVALGGCLSQEEDEAGFTAGNAPPTGNSAPNISGNPAPSVKIGEDYLFAPVASDADGDLLTFSAENLPTWAAFDAADGALSGRPTLGDVGVHSNIRITVSDGQLNSSLPAFSIEVLTDNANSPPAIAGSPAARVDVNQAYDFTPTASDSDGDALAFSVSGLPGWASFNATTGRLFGTPGDADVGVHNNIVISVSDAEATTSLPAFSIEVVAVVTNTSPSISGIPAPSISAGVAYSFTPAASDPDGDSLTFSISGQPGWTSFSSATGALSGTPDNGDAGMHENIRISVSDGQATSNLPAFSIEVLAVVTNSPPTIFGSPALSVDANQAYSFTPSANDPDGDALTFSIVNRPRWASFDSSTGHLIGTPADSDVGIYGSITISVSDGAASATLSPFAIEVVAVATNALPTISGSPAPSVDANQAYSFTPTASDADGDALTFSIVNRPPWASFDTATGQLFGTPEDADVGVYNNIRISVSDGEDTANLPAFSIEVVAVVTNSPPTISGSPPPSVDAGSAYSFTPAANDPDGDALTFSIVNRPPWASFDLGTGRLGGVPGDADVGIHGDIRISVTDGQATSNLPPFSVEVIAVVTNAPPTISGSPATSVNANDVYSFTPTASDPDGDTLVFSIVNKPGWASFNTATGQVSGTPTDADVGSYASIEITVSDGQESKTLGPFTITVNAVSLGSVTLNWAAPTQNVDGTPLTDLAGYRIYWGTTPGTYPNSVTIDNPGLTTYVIDNLAPGTYEFVATSFDATGVESAHSNPATMTVSDP